MKYVQAYDWEVVNGQISFPFPNVQFVQTGARWGIAYRTTGERALILHLGNHVGKPGFQYFLAFADFAPPTGAASGAVDLVTIWPDVRDTWRWWQCTGTVAINDPADPGRQHNLAGRTVQLAGRPSAFPHSEGALTITSAAPSLPSLLADATHDDLPRSL